MVEHDVGTSHRVLEARSELITAYGGEKGSQREKEAWQADRCWVNIEDDGLLELPFILRPPYGIFPKAARSDVFEGEDAVRRSSAEVKGSLIEQ